MTYNMFGGTLNLALSIHLEVDSLSISREFRESVKIRRSYRHKPVVVPLFVCLGGKGSMFYFHHNKTT